MAVSKQRLRGVGLLLLLFVAGCAATPETEIATVQPQDLSDRLVLLYMPGSGQEFRPDPCDRQPRNSLGHPPKWFADLDGTRIGGWLVYAKTYCTPTKVGEYNAGERSGTPKVVKRAKDIGDEVRRLNAQGVPPERIFLIGNSAGGWASLLTAVEDPTGFNGIVAMAPAFAGEKDDRDAGWWWIRERLQRRIESASQIDALVFAFAKDAFEEPCDLEFLGRIDGIRFEPLPSSSIDGVDCSWFSSAHRLHQQRCFYETQLPLIREFIEERVPSRLAGS